MFDFKLVKEDKVEFFIKKGVVEVSTTKDTLSFSIQEELDLRINVGLFKKSEIYQYKTLSYIYERLIEEIMSKPLLTQGTITIPTNKIVKFNLMGSVSGETKTVYNRFYKRQIWLK